ncbi:MAG: Uma2 family endonuclease [Planctomycetota bacterium]
MSASPDELPRYTVSDYASWKGNWELWNGYPIATTPSPIGKHQVVLGELFAQIRSSIRASGCRANALIELDWIVDDATVVRPDLVVVCGEFPQRHLELTPDLVVEVLSPSTRQNDWTFKQHLYAANHVKTYIIADPDEKSLDVLRLAENSYVRESFANTDDRCELSVCDHCSMLIDPSEVFTG